MQRNSTGDGRASPTALAGRGDDRARAWAHLVNSPAVRHFQRAFLLATGLPVSLLPVAARSEGAPPREGGGFCVRGCLGAQSGRWCLLTFQKAERRAIEQSGPVRFRCPSGLMKIVVPVMLGDQHVGNVLVGPFTLARLERPALDRLLDRLRRQGREVQLERLLRTWRQSPRISAGKAEAACALATLLAQHLAESGNRLVLKLAPRLSPLVQAINAYLDERGDEAVSLTEAAGRVRLSPCHFCKVFKEQTGLTFSEFRVRRRVEKARRLLLNPQVRVSEAAFAAGFGSLPYFNRVFRRYLGCSPSQYRDRSVENQDNRIAIQA